MDPDFDALADGARSAVNKTGEHTLWKAVMGLPAWYFVGDRAGDEAEPLVAAVENEPHLMAFTDPERAGAFSRYRAAQRGGDATGVLNMDVPDAVEYCRALMPTKIEGVLFNHGAHSFQAGLSSVIDMYTRYTRR